MVKAFLDAILFGLKNVDLSNILNVGCWSGRQAKTNMSPICTILVCGSQTGAVGV